MHSSSERPLQSSSLRKHNSHHQLIAPLRTKSALPFDTTTCAATEMTPGSVEKEKRPGRGFNFTAVEDAASSKSWMAVSEDVVVGFDRNGEDFFKAGTDV